MQRDLDRLERETFDLLIVGGGINGAGTARDAAMRGLSTALLEKDDLGDGTSSRSSRLVHGGLRYLEQFRFGLVRESLRERATLLRIAPHVVRPLRFLIPIYRGAGRGPLQLRMGLFFYDHLARRGPLPPHRMIDADETLALEPGLTREGLRGGALYPDAWTDDRRLVVLNAIDAARWGACVANHAEVTRVVPGVPPGFEVHVRETLEGRELRVRARHVVNAAGPMADDLGRRVQGRSSQRLLRLSQGAHLAFPRGGREHALLLFAPADGRVVFVIPEDDVTLLGTTEVELPAVPDEVSARPDEVEYLLRAGSALIPGGGFMRDRAVYAYAGIRPLVDEPGQPAGKLSREGELRVDEYGDATFTSILGGKITSYRALAQRLVDRFSDVGCRTHREPLPGGAGIEVTPRDDRDDRNDRADEPIAAAGLEAWIRSETQRFDRPAPLREASLRHLLGRYGSEWTRVLEAADGRPDLLEPLMDGRPEIGAEVLFAAREEMALRLSDVLLGRLALGRAPGNGRPAAATAARLLAAEHDWNDERRRAEEEQFRALAQRRFEIP